MTTRSDNSECDNPSYSFPLSVRNPAIDDNQMDMSNVFHWINSIEFIRPKKKPYPEIFLMQPWSPK